MFRIIRDYIYSLVTLVVALATLHEFFDSYLLNLSKDAIFSVAFIICLFLWFFIANIYLKLKWGRERKYAQILSNITSGFSGIHELERKRDFNINSAVSACENLCTDVATAFTVITGTKCNVAIKLLTKDTDERNTLNLKVITFSRSHDAARNPKRNEVKHWIDKNTDFCHILKEIDRPNGCNFFSNNLPLRSNYNNTSFKVYGNNEEEVVNLILRYWRWPLPYKSTIIVPICPCDEPSSKKLQGFLCVDSVNIGAFRKDYDVVLLSGIADGIYNLIKEISKLEDSALIEQKDDK